MVSPIQELTGEWERKTQNKLRQSSVFGAGTTGRGVEEELVLAGSLLKKGVTRAESGKINIA